MSTGLTGNAELEYAALAAGAFASWLGLPGPGEPLLIAAGILAAKHKLGLAPVLVVAFVAASTGGIGGWLIGMRAGRRVVERPGPLHAVRLRVLDRGEQVYARWPAAAVLLTFSWIAGIHQVPARTYLVWNAVGAAMWAVGIGLGAYFAGPPVVDVVSDVGWLTLAGLGMLIAAGIALELGWRRRRRT